MMGPMVIQQPSNVDQLRAAWRAANDDPEDTGTGWSVTDGETPKLYIFGMVGGYRMPAADFVKAVHAIRAPKMAMHVNSPGGFVWDAVAMYESIKSHPAHVTAHVDGLAASAASFLIQAADEIVMAMGSRMMIHDAQGGGYGSPAEIQETVDMLNAVSDDIASIYAERAGGKPSSWRRAMTATTRYSAQQAVDAKLADRVASRSRQSSGPDNRSRLIKARTRVALGGV
jgi:ATP-dependent protease ClpP protease subunit